MAIKPLELLQVLISRTEFTDEDKKILQQNADWGSSIAAEMSDTFTTTWIATLRWRQS